MEVKASANHLRTSARKVRLVIDVVRGLDAKEAAIQLKFMQKDAALPVRKLLESALANAANNFQLDKSNLYIKTINANEGPVLKRWMPKAFGRATTIRKKSSHINLILAEKIPTDKTKKQIKKEAKEAKRQLEVVSERPKDSVKEGGEGESQDKGEGKKGGKGFTKKLFNRKAG